MSFAQTNTATKAIAAKRYICQPSWPARNEKAAPVLWANTRLKKDVTALDSPR